MELTIRSALKEDFVSVYPLFEQLWPNKILNREELKKVFDRGVDSKTDELFCAVSDGKIIGFCAYAIVNNLWQEGYISYLYAMVVDENHRGKSVGTKLIGEAISKSNTAGNEKSRTGFRISAREST